MTKLRTALFWLWIFFLLAIVTFLFVSMLKFIAEACEWDTVQKGKVGKTSACEITIKPKETK